MTEQTQVFPNEENLPTDRIAIYELLQAAKDAKLSFRYVNVLRHRLMDSTVRMIEEAHSE